MKSLSILAAAFVLGFAAAAAQAGAASAAEPASLTVTFKGVKEKTGAILFTVVSEEGYDGKSPAVAQDILPVSGDTASKTFTGLAPGRYAIKAFHDVNGDGKMGTNPFGMPVEPFAFSNNAVGNMGPAKWEAAAFEVKAGANTQSIDID